MARFNGKNISGAIGPVTFRQTKKGGVISKRVKYVRQTNETKESANFFGRVASFAGYIRRYMSSVGHRDTAFMNRLNTEMLAILLLCYHKEEKTFNFSNNYFNRLNGMGLNSASPLAASMWPIPAVSLYKNLLTISIPELSIPANLKFPPGAGLCHLIMQLVQADLNGGHFQRTPSKVIAIPYNQRGVIAQNFTYEVAPGTLCMVAIGLRFYKMEQGMHVAMNSIDFSPAAIAFAMFNDGVFAEVIEEPFNTGTEAGRNTYWTKCHGGFPIG